MAVHCGILDLMVSQLAVILLVAGSILPPVVLPLDGEYFQNTVACTILPPLLVTSREKSKLLGQCAWKSIALIFQVALPPLLVGLGCGVAVIGVSGPCAFAEPLMPTNNVVSARAARLIHNSKRVRIVCLRFTNTDAYHYELSLD